jgi:ribonuclease R
LEKGEGDFSEQLIQLNTLAKVLRAKRMKKGSINFITPEVKFELSEDGIPLNIKLKTIVDSNKLIEEFMLLANQIVAKHITKISGKNLLPFVYRIHDEPEEEKMRELGRFVNSLGYKFSSKTKNKSKEIQKLLSSVENSMEESVVNVVAIRSMAKAVYSADNIGHYGLGFTHYSHFTSPIRRFPDLVIHKLLYKYLENESAESYSKKELDKISNHSSNQERNAISAERLSVKLKQIDYLSNKIGYEFDGIISGVTNFGIFVELCDTLSEGLIKLRDMEDDYYVFDEQHYAIIGKVSKQKYRLGDKVRVKLIRIDKERREVDFILV